MADIDRQGELHKREVEADYPCEKEANPAYQESLRKRAEIKQVGEEQYWRWNSRSTPASMCGPPDSGNPYNPLSTNAEEVERWVEYEVTSRHSPNWIADLLLLQRSYPGTESAREVRRQAKEWDARMRLCACRREGHLGFEVPWQGMPLLHLDCFPTPRTPQEAFDILGSALRQRALAGGANPKLFSAVEDAWVFWMQRAAADVEGTELWGPIPVELRGLRLHPTRFRIQPLVPLRYDLPPPSPASPPRVVPVSKSKKKREARRQRRQAWAAANRQPPSTMDMDQAAPSSPRPATRPQADEDSWPSCEEGRGESPQPPDMETDPRSPPEDDLAEEEVEQYALSHFLRDEDSQDAAAPAGDESAAGGSNMEVAAAEQTNRAPTAAPELLDDEITDLLGGPTEQTAFDASAFFDSAEGIALMEQLDQSGDVLALLNQPEAPQPMEVAPGLPEAAKPEAEAPDYGQ